MASSSSLSVSRGRAVPQDVVLMILERLPAFVCWRNLLLSKDICKAMMQSDFLERKPILGILCNNAKDPGKLLLAFVHGPSKFRFFNISKPGQPQSAGSVSETRYDGCVVRVSEQLTGLRNQDVHAVSKAGYLLVENLPEPGLSNHLALFSPARSPVFFPVLHPQSMEYPVLTSIDGRGEFVVTLGWKSSGVMEMFRIPVMKMESGSWEWEKTTFTGGNLPDRGPYCVHAVGEELYLIDNSRTPVPVLFILEAHSAAVVSIQGGPEDAQGSFGVHESGIIFCGLAEVSVDVHKLVREAGTEETNWLALHRITWPVRSWKSNAQKVINSQNRSKLVFVLCEGYLYCFFDEKELHVLDVGTGKEHRIQLPKGLVRCRPLLASGKGLSFRPL